MGKHLQRIQSFLRFSIQISRLDYPLEQQKIGRRLLQFMRRELPSLHQDDITVKGSVAVWIGDYTSEVQADGYMNLSRGFERDFGFLIAERRGPEMAVTSKPVPIRELVEGFSSWGDYADAVIAAAESAGITSASTMLVFHWVEFDPKRVSINLNAPMRFLGNFRFQGFR